MKLNRKITAFSLLAFVTLSIFFVSYESYHFVQANKESNNKLKELPTIYKNRNHELNAIILYFEGLPKVRLFLTKRLISNYHKADAIKGLHYQCRMMLWTILLGISFNDDEVISLWCYYAPYVSGSGLKDAAEHEFGKNLDQLNTHELIAIVANTKSPLLYKQNPSLLQARVKKMIASYESSK
jgi:hypothetical protein